VAEKDLDHDLAGLQDVVHPVQGSADLIFMVERWGTTVFALVGRR
jgi:hypothetical protein